MWRNHPLGNASAEKRFMASDLTRSTIRSIFEADDIFKTKVLSYLDNPPEPPSDPLFPTDSSLDLLSMIHGTNGACVGQTIHQVLRDPSVFRKQIFFAMMRFILNGINISSISSAWTAHKQRFIHSDDDRVLMEQFEIWSDAIRHTLVDTISALLEKLIYTHADDDRYCRFVDWITSVGVVPITENLTADRQKAVGAAQREFLSQLAACQLLGNIDSHRFKTLQVCVTSLMTREIPNVPNLRIHRLKQNGTIECFSGKKRLKQYVYAEPMILEENHIIFTTPLARIRYERIKHNELRTHRKVCQLLNTHPVKVVTASRHETNIKRIVELMEKRDRHVDAKTSIVKFLLNVSDSKSKIGLEDSVECFLQDLTPSVDQSRLLPSRTPITHPTPSGSGTQDIRDLFRRQVIRCLEDQIQDHVEEIENLKLLNKTWEGKTRELRDALDRYESEGRRTRGPPSSDLQTTDTLNALRRVQAVQSSPVLIDDNRMVSNSFFSQFVPDEYESDDRLSKLWENEYFRCFKFRKNVNNQGGEDSTTYSNYTIERVLLPFLTSVINFPMIDAIPEEYLFLSLNELANVIYETSRLCRYIEFLRYRETIRIHTLQERHLAVARDPNRPSYARFVEPGLRTPVADAYGSSLSDNFINRRPLEVYHRIRSPYEKLDTLRSRRNVQHING
uniref:Capsid portal protein n=1 Tax=Mastomys natalensis cytomegalovirus 1 TaxID=2973541 RepID=A0A9Y1INM5_9BETA|nr:capsid portal protein [Mastomys natalensis cytomegalovirus 1]WEG68961.1 capsid portal protein [Mastomys natalensis cytomegalovirus 1]WEG71189.1 capsid portal protein [Mastomys natalensis cytomegalovirus 1]